MLHGRLHGDDTIMWKYVKRIVIESIDVPDLALIVRGDDDMVYIYDIESMLNIDEEEMNFVIEKSIRIFKEK